MMQQQQRVQQVTDPVLFQVRRRVQQFRENPSYEKLDQISQAVAMNKKSVQWEAIIHELFNLFNETYNENLDDEFKKDSGRAFYVLEILYGLKSAHPEVDIQTIVSNSLKTFPNKKKYIREKLLPPIIREWKRVVD
jgi:hypothetical protein